MKIDVEAPKKTEKQFISIITISKDPSANTQINYQWQAIHLRIRLVMNRTLFHYFRQAVFCYIESVEMFGKCTEIYL